MPKLSRSVQLAAWSILILSSLHIVCWAFLSYLAYATGLNHGQLLPLFLFTCLISAAGTLGIAVGIGVLRARSGARVAALVLGAAVAAMTAFGAFVMIAVALAFGSGTFFLGLDLPNRTSSLYLGALYIFVFSFALWWIILFSRKSVAVQFVNSEIADTPTFSNRMSCPPPIALLAWLMIASSALSAASWPLVLGKIPAMLFTHIFSGATSRWIWVANIILFLACGSGLLKLQPWGYSGSIALHVFWLISLFVTQLSANYEAYARKCVEALGLAEAYPILHRIHLSPWVSATTTAIPAALLIAGLFYYRRAFLQAVDDSRHLSS